MLVLFILHVVTPRSWHPAVLKKCMLCHTIVNTNKTCVAIAALFGSNEEVT